MIYKYDGLGEKCPVPLIQLRLLLKKMLVDDECIITLNDAGSIQDIPKLLTKQGYQYKKQINEDGVVKINIKVGNASGAK
jgi:TusA-related sulfurtransferase